MKIALDKALQMGINAHKQRRFREADLYYTAILNSQPNHPDANHNMGLIAVEVGKFEEAIPFFKIALEASPKILQFWLSYIDALINICKFEEAAAVLGEARQAQSDDESFKTFQKELNNRNCLINALKSMRDPTESQISRLIKFFDEKQYRKTLQGITTLLKHYPKSFILHNIQGASYAQLGHLEDAIECYKRAIVIKSDYPDAFNNMGNALKDQGKLEAAIDSFKIALSIKPDLYEAYNSMGNALKDQGKLCEAELAFKEAITLRPDYYKAFNNMGFTMQLQGKIDEALNAYKKSISINPNYAEAYNNLGNALQDIGEFNKAKKAYAKAISIKPRFSEAHRHLSAINHYTEDDPHFIQVQKFFSDETTDDYCKCNLSFALAKMYEDIGKLEKAFEFLSHGNFLRKKLLNYSIENDKKFFYQLKNTQKSLSRKSISIREKKSLITPIFIIGMPKSGTTLVEQIISSHSKVTGAGELNFVSKYGRLLAHGEKSIDQDSIADFRKKYLREITNRSDGNFFVTDKMPSNFCFIPLICLALPEAKIIHVKRDPMATCWSNFKQYFAFEAHGYCYNLNDLVTFYGLYEDLMESWQTHYGARIYNLDYEKLTTYQNKETKRLIKNLDLTWENACLAPQSNNRSVRTGSQQQVRQKVYKGSSKAWLKYKPFLNGAFDSLLSL